MRKRIFKTAFGWSAAAVTERGVCSVVLPQKDRKAVGRELAAGSEPTVPNSTETEILLKAVLLLQKYFSGGQVRFDLPLDLRYYTPFQQSVWRAAAAIPFGETRSYSWIAGRIGKTKACRAVGQAVGANPVPILVP